MAKRPSETARRIADHPLPEQMLITKFGDPLPRPLPDGRVIPDEKMVEGLSDLEAMEWLDGIEKYLETET